MSSEHPGGNATSLNACLKVMFSDEIVVIANKTQLPAGRKGL